MSRSLARRLAVVGAAAACLAGAALPALADHGTDSPHDVTVSLTATAGGRHFHVLKAVEDAELTELPFDGATEQPFRVVVEDSGKELSGGFQVSASMTNLYFWDPVAQQYDTSSVIPSRNISLGYSADPLAASGVTLPVRPQVDISGTLSGCMTPSVATLLGINLTGIGTLELLLSLLSGAKKEICTALGDSLAVATTHTETSPVPLAVPDASTLLGLADLPVSLVGGQESGAFADPAYRGVAPAAPAGARPATSKRVLNGRPNISTTLLDTLRGVYTSTVTDAGALVDQVELLEALGGVSPGLVTGLKGLGDTATVDSLLAPLDMALRTLEPSALSTVSGTYTARPVLRASTVAARPGTYRGTLTLDFVDGVR